MSHKFILLFFSLAVALSSCDTNSDSPLEVKTIDTTTPVPTLFNESRSDDYVVVDDGECVIGCILQCAQHHGVSVTREAIIDYFGDNVVYDISGTRIVGIEMNLAIWKAAFNNWFSVSAPSTVEQLRVYFENHPYAIGVCRVPYERTHALFLDLYFPDKMSFACYDPVLGASILVPYESCFDALIVHKKL